MDVVTLAMLNGMKKDGGVGYTEPAKVFTCDGNPNGENMYNGEHRISEKVLDLTTFTTVTMFVSGQAQTMTKEQFVSYGGIVTANEIGSPDGTWLVRTAEDTDSDMPVGTYVWCDENGYVSAIEFSETVHPIDPKYIPNYMPYVELNYTLEGFSAGENAALDEACKIDMPAIIKLNGMTSVWYKDGEQYALLSGGVGYYLAKDGDRWVLGTIE